MTPTALRAALSRLGLTQGEAARLLKISPRTIRYWLTEERPIPHAVSLLLDAWTRHPKDLAELRRRAELERIADKYNPMLYRLADK